jgi:hypothetical protein
MVAYAAASQFVMLMHGATVSMLTLCSMIKKSRTITKWINFR